MGQYLHCSTITLLHLVLIQRTVLPKKRKLKKIKKEEENSAKKVKKESTRWMTRSLSSPRVKVKVLVP